MPRRRDTLADTLTDIDRVIRAWQIIRAHLADLHGLAWGEAAERQGERAGHGGISNPTARIATSIDATWLDENGELHTDRVAVLRRLVDAARAESRRSVVAAGAVEAGVRRCLGGPPPLALRGSTISPAEHAAALEARSRRLGRTGLLAEYEPAVAAGLAQPAYPHTVADRPVVPEGHGSGSDAVRRHGWRRQPLAV